MLLSHLDHAVVAGSPEFVERLLDRWPIHVGWASDHERLVTPARDGAARFVDHMRWLGGATNRLDYVMSWLRDLLVHVYGAEAAERLLAGH